MSETSFQNALDLVTSTERPLVRGKVRLWRRSLNEEDRAAFDLAVDQSWRISTTDLHRAVVRSGGTHILYHDIWAYRTAVKDGVQR